MTRVSVGGEGELPSCIPIGTRVLDCAPMCLVQSELGYLGPPRLQVPRSVRGAYRPARTRPVPATPVESPEDSAIDR